MAPKVLVLCFFLAFSSSEEVKRDKRTVDHLLRGVADVFGYDVLRRITNPRLTEAVNPRPTFFPPPVAPLPPGSYSRIMLALGQQQQQQRQGEEQRAFLIPNQGSITANAQALTLPQGAFILPISGVQPVLASANLQATIGQPAQQNAPPPPPQANNSQPPAPQSTPQAARQTAPAQNQPQAQQQNLNLPFQIVALAPFLAQQQAQQTAPPTTPQPPQPAQQQGASPAPQGINLVFDSGPTRLNLLAPQRSEGVRRSLNFNLNWNREPITLGAQNQAVQASPATPPAPQSAALVLQPLQQQQQPPAPNPTVENFEVLPTQSNAQFNNFYNIPNNFVAKENIKNPANEQFRQSVKSFWDNSPWNSKNGNLRRADTESLKREDVRSENIQKQEVNEENQPHYEEYESPPHTEDVHGDESDSSEEEKDENSGESSEETEESKQAPSKRIRYKPGRSRVKRMRKVKKSVDAQNFRTHEVVKREEKSSKPSPLEEETEVKNYYKKFVIRKTRGAESMYKPIGSYTKDSYNTDFSFTVPETKQDYSALESKIDDVESLFPKNSKVLSKETKNGYTVVNVAENQKAKYEAAAGQGHGSEYSKKS